MVVDVGRKWNLKQKRFEMVSQTKEISKDISNKRDISNTNSKRYLKQKRLK